LQPKKINDKPKYYLKMTVLGLIVF